MTSKAPVDTSGPGELVGSEGDLSSRDVAAHLAILNLEGEYARTWDSVDPEGWAGLFTPEGIFEMLPVGNTPGDFYQGREALADFCRRINASYRGLHLIHVPSIRVEGDSARGWIHFEFRSISGSTLGSVAGIYQVDYRRTEEGWRIEHRIEQAVARSSDSFSEIPETLVSQGPREKEAEESGSR
ncbi:MAG: nuclear transport factor 2 family protein [Myxococcota bacterium]